MNITNNITQPNIKVTEIVIIINNNLECTLKKENNNKKCNTAFLFLLQHLKNN